MLSFVAFARATGYLYAVKIYQIRAWCSDSRSLIAKRLGELTWMCKHSLISIGLSLPQETTMVRLDEKRQLT